MSRLKSAGLIVFKGLGILLMATLLVRVSSFWNTHVGHVEDTKASVANQAYDATPNPARKFSEAQPAVTQQTSAPPSMPKPQGTNCYDNEGFRQSSIESDVNPQSRSAFAEKVNVSLPDRNITVFTAGDGNQYLLFVAAPEDKVELQQIEALSRNDAAAKFNYCLQGFSEAQFIIRDSTMNQELLYKMPTSVKEMVHYVAQHGLATPM